MNRSRVVTMEEIERYGYSPDTGFGPNGPRNESIDITRPEWRTDLANAGRLLDMAGDVLRWCPDWQKWATYDGKRWVIDHGEQAEACAKEVAQLIWEDVTDEVRRGAENSMVQSLISFARNTASAKGVLNMLRLARSDARVLVDHEKFDADPMLFNAQNGTIDLRIGKLRPHRREDLLMMISPTTYDPSATCPLWEQTVLKIMGGRAELVSYIQRLAGYWLTGSVQDHVLPIFHGAGANGKTLMITLFAEIMGHDYSAKAPSDLLLAKKDAHPTEKALLFRKRWVYCVEIEKGRRFAEATVKELTGDDRITARQMKQDFWSFDPTHKLIIACNDAPLVTGSDNGIWRRLQMIPFDVTFWDADKGQSGSPELRQDKQLPEKLRAEHSGILNWMIRGCLEWQAKGLRAPEAVLLATNSYRSENDTFAQFVAECCYIDGGAVAEASSLFKAYSDWCERNGERALKRKDFSKRLDDDGYQAERLTTGPHKGRVIRLGIGLLADSELPE